MSKTNKSKKPNFRYRRKIRKGMRMDRVWNILFPSRTVPTPDIWQHGINRMKSSINTKNKKIIGFDTETINHILHTIQMYDGKEEMFWEDNIPKSPIKRLLLFPKNSIIFAHNLPYDLNILLESYYIDFLAGQSPIQPLFLTNVAQIRGEIFEGIANFARFKIKLNHEETPYRIMFIDSWNFFKAGLAKLAKMVGMEKLDRPIYLGSRKPMSEYEEEHFLKYAKMDSVIEYQLGMFILKLHEEFDIPLSISAPQYASRVFRKAYLKNDLHYYSKRFNYFSWFSYSGGRTCLRMRGYSPNVAEYDIRSLYPYASATQPLPFKSKVEWFDGKKTDIGELIESGWEGIARISWKYHDIDLYPALHRRYDNRGWQMLYFPLSASWVSATPEIKEALKENCEINYQEAYLFYPDHEDINHDLKRFMEYFYEEKIKAERDNDPIQYQKAKLCLNSLIGKFAQHTEDRASSSDKSSRIVKTGSIYYPIFASLTLSNAKSILHKYLHKYNALYWDTDSVFTQKKVEELGDNMGQFKLEKVTINDEEIPIIGDFYGIRSKFYFLVKDGVVLACGTHGIWVKPREKVFQILQENPTKKTLSYEVGHLFKGRESLARKLGGMVHFDFIKRTISLREDKKRLYDDQFSTWAELSQFRTDSKPRLK
jgi:hypothetical protein